jgi:hypothetical protein
MTLTSSRPMLAHGEMRLLTMHRFRRFEPRIRLVEP